jgi:Holliday junction resolvase RusA-like endonuclease
MSQLCFDPDPATLEAETSLHAVMRVEATVSKPTCKPDADNLLKAIADALQGVVYDDAAIVDVRVVKASGEQPGLRIQAEALAATSA